jgi:drug/metabolite transporter (DMT)-like permease
MIYLLLSILFSSSLLIFFKLFDKYEVNSVLAIAINYAAAACVGLFFLHKPTLLNSSDIDWVLISIGLGMMFSLVFNLSRAATQSVGMGITSVAMKLGVVFPVIIGIVFYREDFQWINYVGLFLGFTSIYFLNKPRQDIDNKMDKLVLLLPIFVWLGSGVCDSAVQLIQQKFPVSASNGMFSFTAFLAAAISSLSFVIFKRMKWDIRSFIGGVALGIPNYFSIYFLVKALQEMEKDFQMKSSTLFMVNNLSIVILSVGIGLILFKEKLDKFKLFGLFLALLALYLINIKQ